jgi:hypothetical protein
MKDNAYMKISEGLHEEDARLIAAAPELLAALEEVTEIDGQETGDRGPWGRARAAIAKAKG